MKRPILYTIVAVIAIIIALIAVYTLTMSPTDESENKSSTEPTQIFTIGMREYSFKITDNIFPLKIKTGELFQIKLTNEGVLPHELMLVKDKDKIFEVVNNILADLTSQGLEGNMNEYIDKYVEAHKKMITDNSDIIIGSWILSTGDQNNIDLKIYEPGTYWLVCLEMGGTAPKTHLHRNMFAEITVED